MCKYFELLLSRFYSYLKCNLSKIILAIVEIFHCTFIFVTVCVEKESFDDAAFANPCASKYHHSDPFQVAHHWSWKITKKQYDYWLRTPTTLGAPPESNMTGSLETNKNIYIIRERRWQTTLLERGYKLRHENSLGAF